MFANSVSQSRSAQVEKTTQEIKNLQSTRGLTEEQIRRVSYEIAKLETELANIQARTVGQEQVNTMRETATNFIESSEIADVASEIGTGVDQVVDIFLERLEYLFQAGFDLSGNSGKQIREAIQSGVDKGASFLHLNKSHTRNTPRPRPSYRR